MNVLPHLQHSPEWHAARASAFTASEAPAALGASLYTTRSELLREKHTGVRAEVDTATHMRFANGHRAEALARPLAEESIGEDLYNVTGFINVPGIGRPLLASFDGLTLDGCVAFEHKALGAELRKAFAAGASNDPSLLPLHYRAQMQQQCMVAGCERVLFMASEWDADGRLVEEHHCWFVSDPDLSAQIISAWMQFEKDLLAYELQPRPEPVTPQTVEYLPAVSVRMDGALVVQSNLPAFGRALREFVERVPTRPSTDMEFAQAEAACKALQRAEDALSAAEENALASLSDVNTMRRMVAEFRELARTTRLAAEKTVTRRKSELRDEAVMRARRAMLAHIAAIDAELAPISLPVQAIDWAGKVKGLKSMTSIEDKLATALAEGKIAADNAARAIRANLATYRELAAGHEHLFPDLHVLIHKAADDFGAAVRTRIEAASIADESRRQAERAAAHVLHGGPAPAGFVPPVLGRVVEQPAQQARQAEQATVRLGEVCARIGVTMTAAFVADTLGVRPARSDGRAVLFTEHDYLRICDALVEHVRRVRVGPVVEAA